MDADQSSAPEADDYARQFRRRLAWLLAAQAVFAAAWFWFMPGGFAWDHPRFWANRVLPGVLVVATVAAWLAARGGRPALFEALACSMPAAWLGLVVAWIAVFPISWRRMAVVGVAVALQWTYLLWRSGVWRTYRRVTSIAAVAVTVGMSVCWTMAQRAPEPDTRPFGPPPPKRDTVDSRKPIAFTTDYPERIAPSVSITDYNPGGISIDLDNRRELHVSSLLRFDSRSPDGCWTNLAPARLRVGEQFTPVFKKSSGGKVQYAFRGSEAATLDVSVHERDATSPLTVDINAVTELPVPVYSHLNSFCELWIDQYKSLTLRFSPCEDAAIEMLPSDYPIGRPSRLAYLGADGLFRVVEAESGEKGPFRELASGPLADDEPLTITLEDDGVPMARVTLHDWASQAGRMLSPTAGWGLPVNAIEFSQYLTDDGAGTPNGAAISITLAGTSVGRGWDSVGHRAGVYRNRVTVEKLLAESVQPTP